MTNQRVMVCGADGQLGRELQLTQPPGVEAVPFNRHGLDITDASAVERALVETGARVVINGAAYTAVDRAESDSESAHAVNATGPAILADCCAAHGARLLHVSTDFVFDGVSGQAYRPDDEASPLGVYGASKWRGEQAVLASGADALVVRTGWVYSRHGGNFVKTMLRLMAERDRLTVVEDQIGTPTWARGLAEACWDLALEPKAHGIYHWSDAGACSWYDFAVAIHALGLELGLLTAQAAIEPIPATDYPTPAKRPAFSVLDKQRTRALLGYPGHPWREQLRLMLADFKATED